MHRWVARLSSLIAIISIVVIAEEEGDLSLRSVVVASLVLLALGIAARVKRLFRLSPGAVAGVLLLALAAATISLVAGRATWDELRRGSPWLGAVLGIGGLVAATAAPPGVWGGSRLFVFLDRRHLRPVSILVHLHVRAVLADVVIDLTAVDTPDLGGLLDIVCIAGRVEVVVNEDYKGLVARVDEAAPSSGPVLRWQPRTYANGEVLITYASNPAGRA